MPYIGNTTANRFVASKAASVFSGDGSETQFTLDHSVGSDEDILVSVDGVIQEPSVAYAVSNGTTLTFTGAPSSNSGNNIFVYYLFRTVGTVGHPSNQALSATNGTLTGTLAVTGATTLSSDVTIGDASAADKKILFDGNAQDFHIGLDDSTDSLTMGLGSALGTTSHMVIDANGHITKPLQSCFNAIASAHQTISSLNTAVTINFATERFDQNADFDNTNMVFTAPVTGKYLFTTSLYAFNSLDSAASYYYLDIQTSNETVDVYFETSSFLNSDTNGFNFQASSIQDMDAGDTAKVRLYQSGGSAQTQIASGHSHFSGALIC